MRLIEADALKQAVPKAHCDAFQNCSNCTCLDEEQIKELIDNAPTVEQSRWIPVSERMPEFPGRYLVSGNGDVWFAEYTWIGYFKGWSNSVHKPAVEAWMDLPKPPKDS